MLLYQNIFFFGQKLLLLHNYFLEQKKVIIPKKRFGAGKSEYTIIPFWGRKSVTR